MPDGVMAYKRMEVIGNATLYLGDCREILPTLAKHDLGIHDPPYGVGENAHRVASRRKLAKTTDYGDFDWDKEPMSADRIALCIGAAKETIIWGGNYFTVAPSRGWLVWDKVNGKNCFADCELAWTNLKTSVRMFRHMWNGMLRDSESAAPRVHPTQKPIALMDWCVSLASDPKTVIDACMGSAPVGIAAVKRGLKYTGIELMERNFDIACERIENAQRQQKLFEVVT
jgi:site-specific DNA-methyltransferase (adenine-specific)